MAGFDPPIEVLPNPHPEQQLQAKGAPGACRPPRFRRSRPQEAGSVQTSVYFEAPRGRE